MTTENQKSFLFSCNNFICFLKKCVKKSIFQYYVSSNFIFKLELPCNKIISLFPSVHRFSITLQTHYFLDMPFQSGGNHSFDNVWVYATWWGVVHPACMDCGLINITIWNSESEMGTFLRVRALQCCASFVLGSFWNDGIRKVFLWCIIVLRF